jgi:nucleoid DNA-binding protein
MNKADIVNDLSKILSSKKDSKMCVDFIFEKMKDALNGGNKVVISGFGSFDTFVTKVKKARNMKTGEAILVPPKKKIKFKASKEFFNEPMGRADD